MSAELARPVPHPTALSRPFWDACRQRQLTVQQCTDCGAYAFTPRTFCPACRSRQLHWVPSTGGGVIVTYTVIWRAQTPAFEVPYVVAVVRLDEGYEMLTNIVDVDAADVRIGAAVNVSFLDVSEDVTLPCFQLARTFSG